MFETPGELPTLASLHSSLQNPFQVSLKFNLKSITKLKVKWLIYQIYHLPDGFSITVMSLWLMRRILKFGNLDAMIFYL